MNHSFNVDIAKTHGVENAIMIENFYYWIVYNKAKNENFYEGKYWTYNSIRSLTELFPYWSKRQVERIINNLKNNDCILIGNFNKKSYDKTSWYTLTDRILNIYIKSDDTASDLLSRNDDRGCHETVTGVSRNGDRVSRNGDIDYPDVVTTIPLITHIDKPIVKLNKYDALFTNWIELAQEYKGLTKHKALTPAFKKAIDRAYKEYGDVEKLKTFAKRFAKYYALALGTDNEIKARSIQEFYGQKVFGKPWLICEEYDDEGIKWSNKDNITTKEQPKLNFFGEVDTFKGW